MTGKTVEEANALLIKGAGANPLHVTDADGHELTLEPEAVGLTDDFQSALAGCQNQSGGLYWGRSLFDTYEATISPTRQLDDAALNQALTGYYPLTMEARHVRGELVLEEGRFLLREDKSRVPVPESIRGEIRRALLAGESELNLGELEDCYGPVQETGELREIRLVADRIARLNELEITYHFPDGDKVLDASDYDSWLLTSETYEQELLPELKALQDHADSERPAVLAVQADGSCRKVRFPDTVKTVSGLVTDESGAPLILLRTLLQELQSVCMPYNTLEQGHDFRTTDGRMIHLDKSTLGTEVQLEAEESFLTQAFLDHAGGEHTPEITGQGSIGNTYIEVNMGGQRLYYYEEGKLMLSMPVVTGNMEKKRDTPEGVYYIYFKQKNRTLRGPGYASFVHYWMAVYKGIGIHDATWRDEFGGQIYQSGGSHGCVNGPLEQVGILYDMAPKGTPVVLYYG